jgi:hypothetical protein
LAYRYVDGSLIQAYFPLRLMGISGGV